MSGRRLIYRAPGMLVDEHGEPVADLSPELSLHEMHRLGRELAAAPEALALLRRIPDAGSLASEIAAVIARVDSRRRPSA